MTATQTAQDIEISVFIQSIGAYNAGALIGEWVRLPVSADYLDKTIEKIHAQAAEAVGVDQSGDEVEAGDVETNTYGLYDDIRTMNPVELNQLAEVLASLNSMQIQTFRALIAIMPLNEAIDRLDDAIIIEAEGNVKALAMALYERGLLPEIMSPPEGKEIYWDFYQVGKDLQMSGAGNTVRPGSGHVSTEDDQKADLFFITDDETEQFMKDHFQIIMIGEQPKKGEDKNDN